ncbi:MAG: DMT family transporter [Gemmatimonadales bacterium]|nr:DMT family transporter [Gemmatimonadales bacterium]
MTQTNDRRAMLFGLGAVLIWSTVATAFKLALRHVDHVQLLLLANVFSLVALGVVLAVRGQFHLLLCASGKQYRYAAALGFLNPFLYYLVLFKGYDLLPAQVAQPVNFTWALTMAWLSVPLLGQKLRPRDGLAGLICYSGVVILSTGGDLGSFQVGSPLGLALVLFSTLIWALYWIGNRRSDLDPVVGLFLGFLFALPCVFLVTVVFSDLSIPLGGWLGGAYVGAFEMGFTFVLWLTAMKLTHSTARIANLIFLAPFISLVFIHFVLGEHIVPATFVGLVLIVGGLWVQQPRKRK